MTVSILANAPRQTYNKWDFLFLNSSIWLGHIVLMLIPCFNTCWT